MLVDGQCNKVICLSFGSQDWQMSDLHRLKWLASRLGGRSDLLGVVAMVLFCTGSCSSSYNASVRYRVTVSVNDGRQTYVGSEIWHMAIKEKLGSWRGYTRTVGSPSVTVLIPGAGSVIVDATSRINGSRMPIMLLEHLFGRRPRPTPSDPVATVDAIAQRIGDTATAHCDYDRQPVLDASPLAFAREVACPRAFFVNEDGEREITYRAGPAQVPPWVSKSLTISITIIGP